MSDEIVLERDGSVAILRLNRPEKLNALTMANRAEIQHMIDRVRSDDEIRTLIITGTGRGFCAGADMGAADSGAVVSRRDILEPVGRTPVVIAGLEKPTIAAVNGVAVGAGLSIALACDIRIAAENARFGAMWVKRGLMPDGGTTYYLPYLLGMSRALELMYTGDMVEAREAERIGLVSRVVPLDQLMETARGLAHKIAKGPPIAIELIKRAAYKALYERLEAQMEFETYGVRVCEATQDHKEGIRSFVEKREPDFKGI
ncbi:MAG: enoyl-CoA hydratase [Chloroflexi bacterium]|nr:enoyl-CoA hydratase [Chloroflexota bacterium]